MKYRLRLFSLAFLIVFSFSFNKLIAQNCLVMVDELVGTYKGKCKNGYAHGKGKAVGIDTYEGKFFKGLPSGKGTYTWANGDTYTGQWKKGKREGYGVFKITIHKKDSILDGMWLNNEYKGPKPKSPKVLTRYNVDSYRFNKKGTEPNRVLISFKQNGAINADVTDLTIICSSGMRMELGTQIGYENVEFPVKIKVVYKTPNKLKTTVFDANIEFEIFEPGDWEVVLNN